MVEVYAGKQRISSIMIVNDSLNKSGVTVLGFLYREMTTMDI